MADLPINKVVYGGKTLIDLTHDNITQEDVLENISFHSPDGLIVQGTMPNNSNLNGTIQNLNQPYTIPLGYHNGMGKVTIDANEQEKLIASNIREGIQVLGIEGTMSDIEGMKNTTLSVIPQIEEQNFIPSDLGDFNSIEQVTIAPIPIIENDNNYGGKTVTIGIKAGE